VTAEPLATRPVPGRPVPAGPVPSRRASALTRALDVALAEAEEGWSFPGARRWWVTTKDDGIELHTQWAPHVSTPVLRSTRVAAGTALLAVRLAVAVSGTRPVTTVLPGGLSRGLLAIVRCGTVARPTRAERVLFDSLARTRRPDREISVSLAMPLLRSAAEAEGAWLRTVDPAECDRLRALLPDDRARNVPPGALLAVLGSHGELPAGDLRAGQGLQRVRCAARALGLAATVLAGPAGLVPARRAGVVPGLVPQVLVQVTSSDEQ
jgi:hypothetical protein